MSYGDYGGRSYDYGVSRDDRVDVVPPGRSGESWTDKVHALLGDGPILVGLYKQTSVTILRDGVEVPLGSCLIDPWDAPADVDPDDEYFDSTPWQEAGRVASFAVDGHRIDVLWTRDDGSHVHARLTQPDGGSWTGWSGYGIGAGHTEEGSSRERARVRAMDAAFSEIDPELPAPGP